MAAKYKNKWFRFLSENHVEILFLLYLMILRPYVPSLAPSVPTRLSPDGFFLAHLDSRAYLSLAELSFLDPNFWLGWRPIGLPLIFKIMGTGFLFCIFQTLVYLFSWLFFYRTLKIVNKQVHKDCFLSFIILLTAFLRTPFDNYKLGLLTESLSLSLLLIIVSCFIRLAVNKDDKAFFLLIPCSILFSVFRDINAFILVFLSLSSFFVFITPRKEFKRFFGLLAISLIFFAYAWYGVNNFSHKMTIEESNYGKEEAYKLFKIKNPDPRMAQRWVFPLLSNFTFRIVSHPDFKNFAKNNRIPNYRELIKLNEDINKIKDGGNFKFVSNPRYYMSKKLSRFRAWFLKKGKITYLKFLIFYPFNTVKQIFHKLTYVFTFTSEIFVIFLCLVLWLFGKKINQSSNKKRKPSSGLKRLFLSLGFLSLFMLCVCVLSDYIESLRHCLPPLLLTLASMISLGVTMNTTIKSKK